MIATFKQKCCKCSAVCCINCVFNTVPILTTFKEYRLKWLIKDIAAGITVAVMHIPQGLAYAILANVAPVVGIFMAIFPAIVYAIFGTSRHLSIGSFAVVCLMTGHTVRQHSGEMDGNDSSKDSKFSPIEVATSVSFTVAVLEICMYILRFGHFTRLFSEVMVSSYTNGAAVHVLTTQVTPLLGIPHKCSGAGILGIAKTYNCIFSHITDTNVPTVIVSLTVIIVLSLSTFFYKRYLTKRSCTFLPLELLIIAVSILVSYYAEMEERFRISVVGHIPLGFPLPQLPKFELFPKVLWDSIFISAVAFSTSISMAIFLAKKSNYSVDSHQELLAYGLSNLAGSLTGCAPVASSLSRSVIQQTSGGQTQLASVFSALILVCVVLWMAPLFSPVPLCVLAGIIVVSLQALLCQIRQLPAIFHISLIDGVMWILIFTSVIVFGMAYGLIIGILLSLLAVFYQSMEPRIYLLGKATKGDLYVALDRYTRASEIPGVKILQISGTLTYPTIIHFEDTIVSLVGVNPSKVKTAKQKATEEAELKELLVTSARTSDGNLVSAQISKVVIDLSLITHFDYTASRRMIELVESFINVGIKCFVVTDKTWFSTAVNSIQEALLR